MSFLRSKHNREAHEQTQELFNNRVSENVKVVLEPIQYATDTRLSPTLFNELCLSEWLKSYTLTQGGASLIERVVATPISNKNTLVTRQRAAKNLPKEAQSLLMKLKQHEADVLWLFGLPPIKESWAVALLFPQWPVISTINHIPTLLALYHLFRSFLAPWGNIVYPLSTIFGPYIYIRKSLKWPIQLKSYLNLLRITLTHMLKPADTLYTTVTRYATLLAYAFMFLYGVVQSFDLAAMLRRTLKKLHQKLHSIREFVATFNKLKSICGQDYTTFLPPGLVCETSNLSISSGLGGLYDLWTNEKLRKQVSQALHSVYAIDIIHATKCILMQKGWCAPVYVPNGSSTRLLSMGHPLLTHQVRNPANLEKNIIITGPNAAGKTTYMKAVCCNILLAQSLGVVCASKASINIVHAIGSFIRVSDTVGKDSLFEAEAKRCADMLDEARTIHENKQNAIYFLDEPMHSTPPTEGAATAMAVVKHLGSIEGIRVFVTTHYHSMIHLENESPDCFHNISMEAIPQENGKFRFPYRLRRGASRQCIAIELLKEKGFPSTFVKSAIEMKNKICGGQVDITSNAS